METFKQVLKSISWALLFVLSFSARAQSLELYGMSGWMFAGRSGSVNIINNAPAIVGLDYILPSNIGVGVSYTYLNTDLEFLNPYNGFSVGERLGFQQNYLMLQFSRQFEVPSNENIIPYTTFGVGAFFYDVNTPNFTTQGKLAFGLGAGVKFMLSEKIGLKLQARIQSPIAGAGLYFGVGTGGVSSGVSTYSYLVQLDTSGGLVFKF